MPALRSALALAAAVALLVQPQQSQVAATVTCPFDLQSKLASTLDSPIVASSASASGSSSGTSSKSSSSRNSTSSGDGSSSSGGVDAGTTDGSSSGHSTSAGSGSSATTSNAGDSSTTTTTPSTTTKTPSTTSPSTTTSSSSSSTTATTGTTTTKTPSTSSTSSGSSSGTTRERSLMATAGSTTGVTATVGTTTVSVTTSGSSTSATVSTGSSSGSSNTTAGSDDTFSCDSTFYGKWSTYSITCGGTSLDVDKAVAAASCVIYSGTWGTLSGSTCVSICAFPGCTNDEWVYGDDNGLASSIYDGIELEEFLSSSMISDLPSRTSSSASATILANSTMNSTEMCSYSSESSFSSCTCSAEIVSSSEAASIKKAERAANEAAGVITVDSTSNTGSVLAPATSGIAGVTIAVTGISAIASSIASSAGAAASSASASAGVAVTTIEVCQFGVMINQLNLSGKSAALTMFGKKLSPMAFTFLPFGKLKNSTDSSSRRLTTTSTSPDSSIATYSRTLGISEDMLFLVTLAGVFCIMAGVLALFGVAYFASGFFMKRDEFMKKFFDKLIALEILIAILSQYTIGVTGTYQIYYSVDMDDATNPKCIVAALTLIFLAIGIIFFGYVVVKKHESEMTDVGKFTHIQKPVCQRYGPIYEEYKYKDRYFFAPKMMLALITGVITGYVGMSSTLQVSLLLGTNLIFFFYLEFKSPHHSRFVQTTTSFVYVMKIAVLILTFFLITAAAADGVPSSVQNVISYIIVGLNLFVLFLLMLRSFYSFYQKQKLVRQGQYDQEDEQTAQDFFKDETPASSKDRVPLAPTNNVPYINSTPQNGDNDEIRQRSGTHMQRQETRDGSYDDHPVSYDAIRNQATTQYIADERAGHNQRRNDVVEL